MSFGNFGGRNRESIRILTHMQNIGVFNELPNDTIRFIQENYRTDVPYHNRIHVLYGLLWLHHKGAPLLAKLAWVGHDAKHNGIKEESPEIQSAFHTWKWLDKNRAWLAERNLDSQDCTRIIDATRFPYTEGAEPDEMIQWVRWTDVMRISSGDTVQYLSNNPYYFPDATNRFCAYFFESSQLMRESPPHETDFTAWFPKAQLSFFKYLQKTLKTAGLRRYHVKDWNEICDGFNEVEKFVTRLCGTKNGDKFLLSAYNFLSNDVTYPEFEDFYFQNF